jgi:multidrug efflux system membrane fusion protein
MMNDQQNTGSAGPFKRILFIACVLLAAAGVAWLGYSRAHDTSGAAASKGGRGAKNGPMPVATATAQKGDIKITVDALGTVTPLATVTLRSQIAGKLDQVNFQEGQIVKAGDVVAQVDPRPYQLAVTQAEGQLQRDQAIYDGAVRDLKRYTKLVAEDSIARLQMDTQQTLVDQYKGVVETDQAQLGTAKLNLEYTQITAPVTGRIGLRQVDIGNYVQVGDANGIAILTQTQPISVVFSLPEDNLQTIMNRMSSGATLPVDAMDRSQTTQLAEGTLSNVDNQIDVTTGTVKMRAQFANTDNKLFPNQFVNVRLLVDTLKDAIVIPRAAVRTGSQGTYVFTVKTDTSTVAMTAITLGPAEAEKIAVTKGVNEGDVIVTDGADKLKDGDKVLLPGAAPPPDDGKSGTPDGEQPPPQKDGGDASQKDGQSGQHHRHRQQQ